MDSLYHAQLLRHYNKPFNYGLIMEYSFQKLAFNHLCGDQATIRVFLVNHSVNAVSIQAKGCVISVAAASIFSEYIKKKSCCALRLVGSRALLDMIGIPLGPVRLKCALLSFDAIMQGLQEYCSQR